MNEAGKSRLPAWRLVAGVAVFVGLAADLTLLAPVYFRNYELQRDLAIELREPRARSLSDDYWRAELVSHAKTLRLPVIPNDIHVRHSRDITTIETSYKVLVDLGLYQVDLHFHPVASSR